MHKKKLFTDILIIGAGITGCCIARELTRYSKKVTVAEKEEDVGWATTKANSGIIHPGYAGEEGSLRLILSHKGNLLFREKSEELDIPLINTGSLLNIYQNRQFPEIERMVKTGKKYGVKGLRIIKDKEKLKELEPNLSGKVQAALYAEETCITSPYEAAIALYENSLANGADFLFNTEIKDIYYEKSNKRFVLESRNRYIIADTVINAAGINSAKVARMIGDDSFDIEPVKGEYILFDPEARDYVNIVNYRLAAGKSKGMLVSPTTGGNFFIGPNYKNSSADDHYITRKGLQEVKEGIEDIFENIPFDKVITTFTGLRAVSTTNDFILGPVKSNPCFIQAAGIQSPGLTCAFAIAEIIIGHLKDLKKIKDKNAGFIPLRKRFEKFDSKDLLKNNLLHGKDSDYGEIVCRCEKVSRAEVIDAIRKGARTLDGVKFRTRAGMGRCQGGYCSIRIMKILSQELGIPFTKITKSGGQSNIVVRRLR